MSPAASTAYRIWIPHFNKVIRTRDIIFNEDAVYGGKKEPPKNLKILVWPTR